MAIRARRTPQRQHDLGRPYQGFRGIITPYDITVTARRPAPPAPKSGCAARCRPSPIPVFQFGLFSENDLSFFAGADFNFGGRVHTNGNLFLAAGNGATLTLADRVTAVGMSFAPTCRTAWDHERLRAARADSNLDQRTSPTSNLSGISRGRRAAWSPTVPHVQNRWPRDNDVWVGLSLGTYLEQYSQRRHGRAARLPLVPSRQGAPTPRRST